MNESELRARYAQLPPLGYDEAPEWTWRRHRLEMRNHVARGDDLSEFTWWSTVSATMFVGDNPTVNKMMRDVIAQPDYAERWKPAITESGIGKPMRLGSYDFTSGNLARHAYHLIQFEKEFGIKTETLHTIVEFGGGYGAMAALIRRLGFTGVYCIYDLPEFLLLQEYYLSNLGFQALYKDVDGQNRFAYPPDDVDLLIACYSLSEVDRDLREVFFHVVKAKYVLIVTQDTYGSADLHGEFVNLAIRHGEYEWCIGEEQHQPGHYHITARRK